MMGKRRWTSLEEAHRQYAPYRHATCLDWSVSEKYVLLNLWVFWFKIMRSRGRRAAPSKRRLNLLRKKDEHRHVIPGEMHSTPSSPYTLLKTFHARKKTLWWTHHGNALQYHDACSKWILADRNTCSWILVYSDKRDPTEEQQRNQYLKSVFSGRKTSFVTWALARHTPFHHFNQRSKRVTHAFFLLHRNFDTLDFANPKSKSKLPWTHRHFVICCTDTSYF